MGGVRGWSRFAGRECGSRGVAGLSVILMGLLLKLAEAQLPCLLR